jgi:hypothetical protein
MSCLAIDVFGLASHPSIPLQLLNGYEAISRKAGPGNVRSLLPILCALRTTSHVR